MFPKSRFVKIKNVAKPHCLIYGVVKTQFGNTLIATLNDIVCYLQFVSTELWTKEVIETFLKRTFSSVSTITENKELAEEMANKIFKCDNKENSIKVLLNGTKFENSVWETLTKIPFGVQWSYSKLAENIGVKKSIRAVASAVAKNEIWILIPCHRVVCDQRDTWNDRWAEVKELKLLDYESNN